ncbi:segregation and condensation protein A [Streptomyces sp. CMB-StM0423]|uniref:segregation and condensation protein A n=1 Tax=Streptomyces sp. CMB-StM0423 TaxID=2059884 RepID=UPI000C6FD9F8|nr:segregation/condensation protein A [Streptomyces sp. CMB-StM0423]AUH43776.1 segregation/condensation protein A [Streptomyces sp. CMB-StM0423]
MDDRHDDPQRPARTARRSLGRGPGGAATPTKPAPRPVEPDPVREPYPEPMPLPQPEPAPVPGPPMPIPGPAPRPDEPGPAPGRPDPEPETEPAPAGPGGAEQAAEPAPEPDRDPGPEAGREPEPGPAPGRVPEPANAPEPAAESRPAAAPASAPETGEGPGDDPDDGAFRVRLANFEGPFDLLLQLISKHKLDVTEVSLHRVTDDFMAHIRAMGPDWDLDQTTEFLVVAATLLDLKAARLLPAAEVEDEEDLALLEARDLLFARLLQYRAYKEIAGIFHRRLEEESQRHPRTVGLEPHHAELLPEVVISIGPEGFARLAVKAMQPKPVPQVYVDHIHAPLVSVQEQAQVVVSRLREHGSVSFQELIADAPDPLTVVARFLALLELYRERAVALDQEGALEPLTVRWTGREDAVPVVTDEFDTAPGDADAADGDQGEGEDER